MITRSKQATDWRRILNGSAAFFVIALAFRGWRVGKPATYVFDETYYVNDALDLAIHGVEKTFVGHPPLGKWMISVGFVTGHYTPFTWRIGAVIAGALVVGLTYAIACRISGSVVVGSAAALLLLMDGIANTTGRFALLDGFAALFTTAALAVLVFTSGRPLRSPTIVGLGVLCGAAVATKWSAAPALAVAVLVCFARARRDVDLVRAGAMALSVVGIAFIAYAATYSPWIISGSRSGNCTERACERSIAGRLVRLPSVQLEMLRRNVRLDRSEDRALQPGWRWVMQNKPVPLFLEQCNGGDDGVCSPESRSRVLVLAKGNVVLWATALPIFLAWGARRARRLAVTAGVGLVAVWAVALWLPWIPFSTSYSYYGAPIVPALAVAVVVACRDLLPSRVRPVVLPAGLLAALVVFADSHAALPWEL